MIPEFEHYVFDLDGTLTNPSEGIFRSLEYACNRLGIPCPDRAAAEDLIGPPLSEIFKTLTPEAPSQLVEEGIRHYRERYSEIGLFENTVYPGVLPFLKELASRKTLSVATAKPQVFAERILEKFELSPYFSRVFGVELTSRSSEKTQVIAKALVAASVPAAACVMIGDREYDIFGAKKNQISSIGVLWGFGTESELRAAGVDHLARTPDEIYTFK